MRDDFKGKFLDSNENLENILKYSKLISQEAKLLSFSKKRLEHGFSGNLYRISDIVLSPSHTCKVPSVILKLCFAPWHTDSLSEAQLLHTLSGLYTRPIIPKLYLHVSQRDGTEDLPKIIDDQKYSFYLLLMEDLHWGTTYDPDKGHSLDSIWCIVDDLAEFHAYQMSCHG
jgi:hypothetical protein